jgi:hypothetical protein
MEVPIQADSNLCGLPLDRDMLLLQIVGKKQLEGFMPNSGNF